MIPAQIPNIINKTIDLKIRNFYISPTYWQAAAIVFLIFLLVWTLARLRHMYVNWSLSKSSLAMLFWGFLLTLILEGFLILGGRTLFTEILGWKDPPKPISIALDAGRSRLINVLGVTDEIPQSVASELSTTEAIISDFQSLGIEEANEVRSLICAP